MGESEYNQLKKGALTQEEHRLMGEPTYVQKEMELMRSILHEYDDFWEWYEDEYGETKREVWAKFQQKQLQY